MHCRRNAITNTAPVLVYKDKFKRYNKCNLFTKKGVYRYERDILRKGLKS